MKSLREYIKDAEKNKVAIGHFNISNSEMLSGVFNAAKSFNAPVIIGVSEGERNFIGVQQCSALIRSIREEFNYPIFLNADHTYSVDKVKEAIDAGFDSVIYDGAKLSFEENASNTRECVLYARKVSSEIIVEGELGFIGQSSKVLDEIPAGVELTSPEQAKSFVEQTGVDLFAPAVGNIHGMLRTTKDPHLDIERIKEIKKKSGASLVLHGGSGTPDEDFVKAIDAGVSVIHISTELRVAFRKAMMFALQENPDEVAPYKYMKEAVLAVEKVVRERLKLFNKIR